MRRGISGLLCRAGLAAVGLAGAALLAPGTAGAVLPNPACGSTIYKSVKLHSNMDCSGSATDGLDIGANRVTVNLNGFALIGTNANCYYGIYNGNGYNRLTITNGTVRDFGCDDIYQDGGKNLSISNVSADGSTFAQGFEVDNSSDGTITGSEASGNDVGAEFYSNHMVTVSGSTLDGNQQGVFDDFSLDTLSGDTIEDNTSDGVQVYEPLTVSSSTGQPYYSILNSTSSYNGSDGFQIDDNSPTTLYQARVRGNTAEYNDGFGYWAYQQVKGTDNGALGNSSGNCFHVPCHNLSP